jgi:DNA-binding response OmpR family regulator
MVRILVVDDEVAFSESLARGLAKHGFEVRLAHDGHEGFRLGRDPGFELVVLDLMLPGMSGVEVCRRLREDDVGTPVLVLTARDREADEAEALNLGADDYLRKPFSFPVLVARIHALLRRPAGALGRTLRAGNVTFDTIGRDITVDAATMVLPRREAAILEHLMRRLGRVVPKSVLEDKLYGIDDELESNAIPVHVHHLRRKLEQAGATAEIHTVRGVGYLLIERT